MARGFNYAPGASDEVTEASAPDLGRVRIAELSASRNAVVRETVARREDCPFGSMVELAHDSSTDVRVALAGNAHAIPSVLEHLARDRQSAVLVAVCGNPATPRAVMDQLAVHRKREVRAAAVAALEAGMGSVAEPAGVPELRDRVFADADLRRVATRGPRVPDEPAAEPVAESAAPPEPPAPRPTRTAPVRGFKPPADV